VREDHHAAYPLDSASPVVPAAELASSAPPEGDAMTEDMLDLARRAVACKGFRWKPGMRTTDGMRVIHEPRLWPDRPCAIREGTWVDTAVPRPLGDHLPDFTDAATLGCLLALVREAWGAPYAQVSPIIGNDGGGGCAGWVFYVNDVDDRKFGGRTEAEALIAALEAAP
jgi:hypothetical protein